MNTEQIHLIENSWEALASRRMELATAFYARLFETEPALRDLFVLVDMESQSAKFLAMVNEILAAVSDPEAFAEILRDSGRRHRGYGVVSQHYRIVGESLIWALEKTSPDGLTNEGREAWAEAYTLLAHLMKQG